MDNPTKSILAEQLLLQKTEKILLSLIEKVNIKLNELVVNKKKFRSLSVVVVDRTNVNNLIYTLVG